MQHTVNPLNSGFLTSSVISPKNILLPIKLKVENRPTQELGCLYKKRTQTFCWQKNFVFATKLDSFNALDETNTHTHNFCAKNFVFIWLFRVHFYFQLSFFFNFWWCFAMCVEITSIKQWVVFFLKLIFHLAFQSTNILFLHFKAGLFAYSLLMLCLDNKLGCVSSKITSIWWFLIFQNGKMVSNLFKPFPNRIHSNLPECICGSILRIVIYSTRKVFERSVNF